MIPSVPHMTWIVKCDTSLSDERYVFSPNGDKGWDNSPMARAFTFARSQRDEARADTFGSGTVTVFCREHYASTEETFYVN